MPKARESAMIIIEKVVLPSREELRERDNYCHLHRTAEMIGNFNRILDESGSETDIHNYLLAYPEMLYNALYKTSYGHHGMKILSKQALAPKTSYNKGMIPDFILGRDSSEGIGWFVIELKGYNDDLFKISKSEIGFSSTANKGICQLLEYMDKGSELQSYIRDYLKLDGFRNPKGILLMGKKSELESNERKKKLRRIFHEAVPSIQLINYDVLRSM